MQIGRAQITEISTPGLIFTAFYVIAFSVWVWRTKAWNIKLAVLLIAAIVVWTFLVFPLKNSDEIFALTPAVVCLPSIFFGIVELVRRENRRLPRLKIETFGLFLAIQDACVDFAAAALREFPGMSGPRTIGGGGWQDGLVWVPALGAATLAVILLLLRFADEYNPKKYPPNQT